MRARKKSDATLQAISKLDKNKAYPAFDLDEKDLGIEYGFRYAKNAVDELGLGTKEAAFVDYFRRNVRIKTSRSSPIKIKFNSKPPNSVSHLEIFVIKS